MDIPAVAASIASSADLQIGLVLTVFLTGLRHGFDLDHIAAITDISSSSLQRLRSLALGTAYIVGHAAVLFLLGALAVLTGRSIPEGVDSVMGRVIGVTLILLGGYVIYSLIRFRRDFRLQSRWMLVLSGIKRSIAWLHRSRTSTIEIEHDHPHTAAGHHHGGTRGSGQPSVGGAQLLITKTHSHTHKHVVEVPADPFKEYGFVTCLGVGMIHGIGAETPSQLLLFTSAANVTGPLDGMILVAAFVAGLMVGNTVLVAATIAGFTRGKRIPIAYMVLAGVTAAFSTGLGLLYLLDRADLLPTLFGG